MDFDLAGYLASEPLPPSRAMQPLFEAVVNAMHAVDDLRQGGGKISIGIDRDDRQGSLEEGNSDPVGRVVGFTIQDNGIGFTDENYGSFNTSFSRYKKIRGGKGVGRFCWLQAFGNVEIESTYNQEGVWYERRFSFKAKDGVIGGETPTKSRGSERLTRVHLKDLRSQYAVPTKPETIAWKILEHCLFAFLAEDPPVVTVTDPSEESDVSLNEMFQKRIQPSMMDEALGLNGCSFRLRHFELVSGEPGQQHSIHLCANKRDVVQLNLSKHIPSLSRKLECTEGSSFYYQCYVEGKYLDRHVDRDRTSFGFPKDGELGFGEPSEEVLYSSLVGKAKEHLATQLEQLRDGVRLKARRIVEEVSPEYRPLLKDFDAGVDDFGPDASEDELVRRFNELHLERELDARNKASQLLSAMPDPDDQKAYDAQFDHYLESVDPTAQVNLAKYVLHRRTLLHLLRKRIQMMPNGAYEREERIHEIVFPMRRTSDDTEFHRWNLWIIDEKLAFHSHLASDRPLSDITGVPADGKEPDLLVLNKPAAFSDREDTPLNSVVIVEFKRPERKGYSNDENPIDQVQGYVRTIRERKALDLRGRHLEVRDTTPFYCYIVADLTSTLRQIAEERGFTKTPDGLGYFWFNPNSTSYVELISLDKLIQDAERRHEALFRKLGL